jgi:hypothetical protein
LSSARAIVPTLIAKNARPGHRADQGRRALVNVVMIRH